MDEYNYDDWAELLAGFFFDEAHHGEEILFAVDELSLAEASGLEEEDAAASLSAAVRLVIGAHWDVLKVKRLVSTTTKPALSGSSARWPAGIGTRTSGMFSTGAISSTTLR